MTECQCGHFLEEHTLLLHGGRGKCISCNCIRYRSRIPVDHPGQLGIITDIQEPDMESTNAVDPEIHHFTSGAGSSGHKPPYECLTRDLLRRAALRMQKGMHYGKHNWKKGATDKAFILDRLNHAIEHLKKAQEEIDMDIPYNDDDLAAVVVNCMFAMEYQSYMPIPTKEELIYDGMQVGVNPTPPMNRMAMDSSYDSSRNLGQMYGNQAQVKAAEERSKAISLKQVVTRIDEALKKNEKDVPIHITDYRFHTDLVHLLNRHGIDTDMNLADHTIALKIISDLIEWRNQVS